jgi:hypothetical protein
MAGQVRDLRTRTEGESSVIIKARAYPVPLRLLAQAVRALLHCPKPRHGGAVISVWAQTAMASSSNATANRRFVDSPVANS